MADVELSPLGLDDLEALRALGERPDVVRYGDHAPGTDWSEWLGAADGNRRVTLAARDPASGLLGAARMSLSARRRGLHAASLDLVVPFDGAAAAVHALVDALVSCADDWLQVARVAHRGPAGHAYLDVLSGQGFVLEGVRRGAVTRAGALGDEAQLARVAADLPRATGGPRFDLPPRAAPRRATMRLATPADGPSVARMFSDPRVAWGTLQLPWQRAEIWTARFEENDPAVNWTVVAELDGELAGTAGLHVSTHPRRRHCASVGMAVAARHQGRGVGRQLLDALLTEADARELARVELEAWTDNARARRLYESRGFVVECEERATGFRAGAFADSVSMARLSPARA